VPHQEIHRAADIDQHDQMSRQHHLAGDCQNGRVRLDAHQRVHVLRLVLLDEGPIKLPT
jgi:hypothetical protein